MRLLERKTRLEKILETLERQQALKAAAGHAVESAMTGALSADQAKRAGERVESFDLRHVAHPATPHRGALGLGAVPVIGKAAKPTLVVAAGVAGITAASAAVSSLRKGQDRT
jgi:hypothetical protein